VSNFVRLKIDTITKPRESLFAVAMGISIEATIAIIGLFITLLPSLVILWKILVARNERRSTVPSKSVSSNAPLSSLSHWIVPDIRFMEQI
jgi:hypothetical protein